MSEKQAGDFKSAAEVAQHVETGGGMGFRDPL